MAQVEGTVQFEPDAEDHLEEMIDEEDGESGKKTFKKKGRGHKPVVMEEEKYGGKSKGTFDRLADEGGTSNDSPQRSVEGWLLLVTGVHEEAQEDDIHDKFAEFGRIKNIHLPLDRRTGYVKGYSLIEFEEFNAAKKAIEETSGTEFMESVLTVTWAFRRGPRKP